jgi:2-dehydro-3-deoxy-D-arabinonate dehydratase
MKGAIRPCRYWSPIARADHIGVVLGDSVYSLTDHDADTFGSYSGLLQRDDLAGLIASAAESLTGDALSYEDLDRIPSPDHFHLLPPMTRQEVWGSGETYERDTSKEGTASPFDRAYFADRPELFFKATPDRVAGPNMPIRARRDAALVFPEPELALIINRAGRIVAFTAGNDVTAYDLADENILYMPQVKIFKGCCGLGPTIVLADTIDYRALTIDIAVERAGDRIFEARTEVRRLVRPFANIIDYLFREQDYPAGVILMTGLGFDLPHGFSIRRGDVVEITMPVIGTLRNPVE